MDITSALQKIVSDQTTADYTDLQLVMLCKDAKERIGELERSAVSMALKYQKLSDAAAGRYPVVIWLSIAVVGLSVSTLALWVTVIFRCQK